MKSISLFIFILFSTITFSQVGIGTTTPNASSALDITSTNAGILVPRMTEAQRTVISSPATGLLVYQTNNTTGFWFFDGSGWANLSPGANGEFQSISGIVQNTTNVGSDDFVFGDTDLNGSGSKFFFDTSKAAFRAGEISGTEWDDINVGDGSMALGNETVASGDYSAALGYFSNASGDFSMGLNGGQASGSGAVAFTFGIASGDNSMAWNGSAAGANALSFGGTAEGANALALMGGTVDTAASEGFSFGDTAYTFGSNGISFGSNTTALGSNATAIGYSSNAAGDFSMGLNGGQASGSGAVAFTFGIASGDNSMAWNGSAAGANALSFGGTAEGANALALMGGTVDAAASEGFSFGDTAYTFGSNGISFGSNTTALGSNATAIGYSSNAAGDFSMGLNGGQASGSGAVAFTFGIASGDNSMAWNGSAAGANALSFGGTAEGANALALMGGTVDAAASEGFSFGDTAYTFGSNGISFGSNTTALGSNATAIGYSSNAAGDFSMGLNGGQASGQGAVAFTGGIASGQNSFAWNGDATGLNSIALGGNTSGEGSIALSGGSTSINATYSLAAGGNAITQGNRSFAMGNNINAVSYGETVLGFNNESYTPNSTTTANALDRLFVVGNGGVASLPSNNNALTILKNGRMGISRIPTTNILEVEGEASKTTAGSWAGNSDARLKKNIQTFSEEISLQKLLQMRGVTYEWNDTKTGYKRPEGIQYGFIAQELMKVFPENVEKDNLGYYQTAYGTYDAMFVQAIKALSNKIEKLENENLRLSKTNDQLLETLSQIEYRVSNLENEIK